MSLLRLGLLRCRRLYLALCCALALTAAGVSAAPPPPAAPPLYDAALFGSLAWREVGPYRGGRAAAVTGVAGERDVYYFGSTGGGVWKTTDGGATWKNVSDGFFGGSIGAVAVAESDPNVVYAGGGEKTVRGNVSHGDGVWKSTDAGKTWRHAGLADSRHVPRLRVHPRDPDLVYAAVLGHLYAPSAERGVYRSRDGGTTWERVLHVSDEAGAVDLALDPTNPRVLYAALWRVRRTPWSLESGGEGPSQRSGLWKSTDGGDSWSELSTKPGFPAGPLGIIGVAPSPADPETVYAVVEAEQGGVLRSRDGGETWEKVNEERDLRQRAWYYTRIYADPADAETVYVVNVRFHRSKDGGRSFTAIDTPHSDNHDLWIDPRDPARMIEANDGGANVSTDGGVTWTTQANQPTAQIYRVSTDTDFPYRLLGAQQDNTALRIRSRSDGGAIDERDWEPTAGGESGHVVADPRDPDVVYGGSYGGFLMMLDHRTGERRAVNVWPDDPIGWGAAELKHRFQWNFPLFFSPHDPAVLYAAANVLFKSHDGGRTWQQISPDLTRDDKSKQGPSGGPITKDNTSVEYYGTIFAALESPHEPGVLWAGSDDGRLHLSRDGGASWGDVTPPELPEWSQVNSLEADPFDPGGLYVAATRYKLDDFAPYLYRTADYGATWQRITAGIDPLHFTRVVRADPDRRGLLYAGTERGVYVSFDDGGRWQPLQRNLPIVPVTDLAVKERELIAATQGRGFWILDDLSPLHQLTPEVAAAPAHLFAPGPAWRTRARRAEETGARGTNPAPGVLFHFWLAEEPAADAELRLEVLEADGTLIRAFTRKPDPEAKEEEKEKKEDEVAEDPRQIEVAQGINRFAWDLRYPGAERFPGMVLWNDSLDGPRALPGSYRARLVVGEWSAEVPFTVRADPRLALTADDYAAAHAFQLALRDKLTETHREIARLRDVRGQVETLEERLSEAGGEGGDDELAAVRAAGKALRERLTAVEEALYQTQNRSPQDPLNFPIRASDKLAGVLGLAGASDAPPTASMQAVAAELTAAIDARLAELRQLWATELPAFNQLVRDREVAAVLLPPAKKPDKKPETKVESKVESKVE